MKPPKKDILFYLNLFLILALAWSFVEFVGAEEWVPPTGFTIKETTETPLDTSAIEQGKAGLFGIGAANKGVQIKGSEIVFKDDFNEAKLYLSGNELWVRHGDGTEYKIGQGEGDFWKQAGNYLYPTSTVRRVGIGTDNPQGLLDVRGDGNIFLAPGLKGSVSIGADGGLVPLKATGNTILKKGFADSNTGYYYSFGGVYKSAPSDLYNGTPDFNWWKGAFSSVFNVTDNTDTYDKVRITNARTNNTGTDRSCEDAGMENPDCVNQGVVSYEATDAAVPSFVVDLFRSKEAGQQNYLIGYILFNKKASGYEGGNIFADANIIFSDGLGAGLGANLLPVSKLDLKSAVKLGNALISAFSGNFTFNGGGILPCSENSVLAMKQKRGVTTCSPPLYSYLCPETIPPATSCSVTTNGEWVKSKADLLKCQRTGATFGLISGCSYKSIDCYADLSDVVCISD